MQCSDSDSLIFLLTIPIWEFNQFRVRADFPAQCILVHISDRATVVLLRVREGEPIGLLLCSVCYWFVCLLLVS